QAVEQPDKVAYHFMGKDTTYGEFEQTVGRFAQGLQDLGIQKGDHVAFLLGNTPHYLIALYATMRLGATAIPVNPIYTPDEISYIIRNGDVKAIVALDALLPLVEMGVQAFPQVEAFIVCETAADAATKVAGLSDAARVKTYLFSQVVATASGLLEPVDIAEDDNAIILYTSGTTGSPKGAMLTHGNVYSNARDVSTYLSYRAEDRIIATLPVFHVFALTVVVNAPLLSGATVLLIPRFSPAEVFALAKEKQATVFAGVPTMYNFLYQFPDGNPEDFGTIRLAISGGASLPVALLHNFEEKFNVRVSEGYGLSEASPVTCFNPLDRERKAGSIGTTINNVENRVVDEYGQDVPVGEVGELIVRGPNVMKGYYKMPEATRQAVDQQGWLHTGDIGTMDDEGNFRITGRLKDMIIRGGENIYPREIEEFLYTHASVRDVQVVGVPDEKYGEEVCACVILREGEAVSEDALIEFVKAGLSRFKAPRYVLLMDAFPMTASGKIQKFKLREMGVERLQLQAAAEIETA
ncbi:MAG: long-chain-fatty-acid--CoA ligase, partial [Clostridia bacterium]